MNPNDSQLQAKMQSLKDEIKEKRRQIAYQGLIKDIRVQSSLIEMYVKYGSLKDARDVFDEMPFHDVVSWTALITGFVGNDLGRQQLKCSKKCNRKQKIL